MENKQPSRILKVLFALSKSQNVVMISSQTESSSSSYIVLELFLERKQNWCFLIYLCLWNEQVERNFVFYWG